MQLVNYLFHCEYKTLHHGDAPVLAEIAISGWVNSFALGPPSKCVAVEDALSIINDIFRGPFPGGELFAPGWRIRHDSQAAWQRRQQPKHDVRNDRRCPDPHIDSGTRGQGDDVQRGRPHTLLPAFRKPDFGHFLHLGHIQIASVALRLRLRKKRWTRPPR